MVKKSMGKIRYFLLVFLFFTSCAYKFEIKENLRNVPKSNFYFLINIDYPQDKLLINKKYQKFLSDYFNYKFLYPFLKQYSSFNKKFASWGFRKLKKRRYYFANNNYVDKNFIEKLKSNANLKNFPNSNLHAITIKNCYLRVLPTNIPVFSKKKNFPFDVLQNSSIYIGTPIYISHISRKGDWAFVESYIAAGWIKLNNIAFVDKKFINIWYTGKYVTPVKDRIPVYNRYGKFIFYAYIGSQYPLVKEEKFFYWINVPYKNPSGKAEMLQVKVSKRFFSKKPINLNYKNLCSIAEELNNQPYFWGGFYFYRDCSMTMRDLFAPFDIYLPRNSYDQINFNNNGGKYFKLSGLSPQAKEEFLKKYGIPYLTLVWMPGHIMLYTGLYKNRAIVFHNFWSVKTKNKRIIIGKSALTSLVIRGSDFRKKIKAMRYVLNFEF